MQDISEPYCIFGTYLDNVERVIITNGDSNIHTIDIGENRIAVSSGLIEFRNIKIKGVGKHLVTTGSGHGKPPVIRLNNCQLDLNNSSGAILQAWGPTAGIIIENGLQYNNCVCYVNMACYLGGYIMIWPDTSKPTGSVTGIKYIMQHNSSIYLNGYTFDNYVLGTNAGTKSSEAYIG